MRPFPAFAVSSQPTAGVAAATVSNLHRLPRQCVGILVGLFLLFSGLLTTTGTAHAGKFTDKAQTKVSLLGHKLRVEQRNLKLIRVSPLAESGAVREGFLSGDYTGTVTGNGIEKINSRELKAGVQIGCQIDVSSGVTLGISGTTGSDQSVTPSGTVTISQQPSLGGSIGGNLGTNQSITPSLSLPLKAGKINDAIITGLNPADNYAATGFAMTHIKVEGCEGRISLRAYGIYAIGTPNSFDQVAVYSKAVWL